MKTETRNTDRREKETEMKITNAKVDMTGWQRTISFDLIAVLREVLHAAGKHSRAVEFSNKAHDNRLSCDQVLDMCKEDGFIEISNRPARIRRAG